jgi:hypothetical protein
VTTFAGSSSGSADGPISTATFSSVYGVGADTNGIIFVSDSGGNRIRMISGGIVTTIVGTSAPSWTDGFGTSARTSSPFMMAVSNGLVYFGDGLNTVRRLDPTGSGQEHV